MAPKLDWPRPTAASAWARQNVGPYSGILHNPGHAHIQILLAWLLECMLQKDTVGLYETLFEVVYSAAPKHLQYDQTSAVRHNGLALVSFSNAVAQLGNALGGKKLPKWARHVFVTLPSEGLAKLKASDREWLMVQQQWLFSAEDTVSYEYILFGHAGTYVGKTDEQRRGGRAGRAERCAEHYKVLLAEQGCDGDLPRYRALWQSMGSVAFFTICGASIAIVALAVGKAVIRMVSPVGNGAVLEGLRQQAKKVVRLRPERPKPRRRPFPRHRMSSCSTFWDTGVFAACVRPKPEKTLWSLLVSPGKVRGASSTLYRFHMVCRVLQFGVYRHLNLFDPSEVYDNMPQAHCSSKYPCVVFPKSLGLWQRAEWIYGLASKIKRWCAWHSSPV